MMGFDLGALITTKGAGSSSIGMQWKKRARHREWRRRGGEYVPLGGGSRDDFSRGQNEGTGYRGTLTQLNDVMPNYFDTLRILLIRGGVLTIRIARIRKVGIANEAMAQHFWPGEDLVGKRFHFFGDATPRAVVGVAANSW